MSGRPRLGLFLSSSSTVMTSKPWASRGTLDGASSRPSQTRQRPPGRSSTSTRVTTKPGGASQRRSRSGSSHARYTRSGVARIVRRSLTAARSAVISSSLSGGASCGRSVSRAASGSSCGSEKRSHCAAEASRARSRLQTWRRPSTVRRRRPARSSTWTCFDAAARDIASGCASSLTVRSLSASRRSMSRRPACARAWKTWSSFTPSSTIWLNVVDGPTDCQPIG